MLRGRRGLSKLSDEEIRLFMESAETDEEEDFSSDDQNIDANYELQEISPEDSSDDENKDPNYELQEISPEDENIISQCLEDIESSDMFIDQAVDFSLNISGLDLPRACSTFKSDSFEKAVTVPSTYEMLSASTASASAAVRNKRPRSPLPSIQATGLKIIPNIGGFIGSKHFI